MFDDEFDNLFEQCMMDNIEPVDEAFLASLKVQYGSKVKQAKTLIKEGKAEDDERNAKKKYEQAMKLLQEVRKDAAKIENDSFFDWFARLFLVPWPIVVARWVMSGSFGSVNRSLCLKIIDAYIKSVKDLM